MAEQRGKFIERVSIEYALNGESLTNATRKSMEDWKKLHKHAKAFSVAESAKTLKALEAQAKKSTFRIEKDRRAEIKKTNDKRLRDELALQRKIANAQKKNEAKKKKGSVSGGFDNFGGKIGTIASYGAAIAVINALRQAITFVVTKTIEFEKSFTDLAVKSGFTSREMAKVTKEIYAVAGSTKFSTLEIVGAATALGKLGFEAKEVIKILPQMATVAGATSESLESTAQVFGKITNAYGYSADNAQNLADRLVQIFNDSALDLEKFNTAFSYVGSAAASTGTSFDELTAAMAVLSDRGVTASKIGTGLRNVFTKLGNEGDTLRDIIVRVNQEQLSFFEISELVGRRAANQLFILMDSIGEFDDIVADSQKKYGTAMKANAVQMSTFSAKWDILLNNVTNAVAGDDADPLKGFRYNLITTMGVMDLFNSMNIFNSSGSESTTSNFLNANQDLFKEIRDLKEANEDITEAEMRAILIKPYAVLQDMDAVQKLSIEQLNSMSLEASQIRKLFHNSDGNDIFEAIKVYLEGEQIAEVEAAKNAYQNNIKSFSAFVSDNTTTDIADRIRQAVLLGNKDLSASLFEDTFKTGAGALSTDLYDLYKGRLTDILSARDKATDDSIKDYKTSSSGSSAFEGLQKEFRDLDAAISRLNTVTYIGEDGKRAGDMRDILSLDKKNDERNKAIEKWCGLGKDQPFITKWLADIGIICKTTRKSRKPREKIEKFEKNIERESKYDEDIDLLNKQFSAEDDPVKKAIINEERISVERTYRNDLFLEFKDYLDRMEKESEAYKKRNPEQAGEYDANIRNVEGDRFKGLEAGNKNLATYEYVAIDAKHKAWKDDIVKSEEYKKKISEINLSMRKLDRKDKEGRLALQTEKNAETKRYYAEANKRLDTYWKDLRAKLKNIKKQNENRDVGAAIISTEEIEKALENEQASYDKLETQKNNKLDFTAGGLGLNEQFDVFPLVMQAYDDVYAVYSQIGEMKLQQIKEQNERELALIAERYDNEKSIVDASLNAGIVSQEQAQEANERLRKKKIDAENKANKTLFEAQKKRDKEEAIFTGISSTAQAIAAAFARDTPVVATVMAAISAAAISASTAMNIGAISKRKFVPQKYADGGLIEGKSHSQGGVPFTVSGYGGFEAEGGEYIVNKEATRNNLAELERINGKTRTGKRKYATGGIVSGDDINSNGFNEALLEALNRPVRAYVTDQDLSKSESERNALSLKTSY